MVVEAETHTRLLLWPRTPKREALLFLKIRVMQQRLFTEEEIRQEYSRCTIGLIYDEEGDRRLSAIRVVDGDIHTLFTRDGDRFRKIGVYDMAKINGSSAKK